MKASRTTIEVFKMTKEPALTLTLTQRESAMLRSIVGKIAGAGEVRAFFDNLYDETGNIIEDSDYDDNLYSGDPYFNIDGQLRIL